MFLNLGDGSFADISAVSGFGIPEDGRGSALVDWDHDGDLDVWISNRTAPQVRLLLNTTEHQGHHLVITLRGTTSNRDAIGAHVIVHPGDETTPPFRRTLRAGDGFLSQSSKRLIVGLGSCQSVRRIEVCWPAGMREQFILNDGSVDQHYHLVEGTGRAEIVAQTREIARLEPLPTRVPDTTDHIRSLCFSMIHLPVFEYRDLDNIVHPVVAANARLTLVNLWASWCQPCLLEHRDWVSRQAELRRYGIDILTLSVDRITDGAADSDSDRQVLAELNSPFRAGRASNDDLDKLQLLNDTIFELHTPLQLPTSFLVDKRGRVVGVYKGPVSAAQLLEDAARLRVKTTDEWRQASLPFSGRWEMPPRQRNLFDYVMKLAQRGYLTEAQRYVEQHPKMLTTHPSWPILLRRLNMPHAIK